MTEPNAVTPTRTGRPPKGKEKVNVEDALKLRLRGLTYEEIGNLLGVGKAAIFNRLKRFSALLDDPEAVTGYRANKAELFEAAELKLLATIMDEEKLKKCSLNNAAYTLTQVNMALRLERGQSTKNIDFLGRILLKSDTQLFHKDKAKDSANSTDT